MKITKEVKEKIIAMYLAKYTNSAIMAVTGIKSSSTLYKVLASSGVLGNRYNVNVVLNGAAAEWAKGLDDPASAIAEIINDYVTKLPYSEIGGGSEKTKIPYSEIDGGEDNQLIDIEAVYTDESGIIIAAKSFKSLQDEELICELAKTQYSKIEGAPEYCGIQIYKIDNGKRELLFEK